MKSGSERQNERGDGETERTGQMVRLADQEEGVERVVVASLVEQQHLELEGDVLWVSRRLLSRSGPNFEKMRSYVPWVEQSLTIEMAV